MRLPICLLLVCTLLAACVSQRGVLRMDPDAGSVGTVEPVFFASNRAETPTDYSGDRSSRVHYGRIDVSVPPLHRPGRINYPSSSGPLNPKSQFLTTGMLRYADHRGFVEALRQALAKPETRGEVVLYVHGFNTPFADATYRLAQLSHDIGSTAVPVAMDWPSAGRPLKYLYDRDSVLFSRNGMVTTLDRIREAGAKSIIIVAHSLGTELTMEALRTMALSKDNATMEKIRGVVLAAADIDTQVFRRQAKEIGKLPQPFVLFVSRRDRVLGLSARLAGRDSRVGNLNELDKVADLPVIVVDVSGFARLGSQGHFLSGSSPTLLKMFANASRVVDSLNAEEAKSIFPGVAQTLENATQIVVSP